MRLTLFLCTLTLLLACTPIEDMQTNQNTSFDTVNHTGCADGSISPNGTCTTAENNNANVFAIDNLDEKVTGERTELDGIPGYLATPNDDERHPSVLMIHEWWGLNDNIEKMARVLASEGYIVFAVDMYNGSVANTSSRAGELSGNVRNNQAQYTQLLEDASESLDDHPRSTGRKASLGWCFGGGQSLQVALSGEDFDGTIIYYGSVTDNQTKLDMIDWPVLGIFGSEDRVIPLNDVRAFNESLNELGIKNNIHVYDGAGHAFANPSGDSFRPNATRDAWNKTLTFLNEHLR